MSEKKLPVKSILISQPKPEGEKNPYAEIAKKYDIKIDFRPFIKVEQLTLGEFRKQRVQLGEFSSIIFTSKNSIDHYFQICHELRVRHSPEIKYYCISEAIALYIQKYIEFRKRKVFFGDGSLKELFNLLLKNKSSETFLLPGSNIRTTELPEFLQKNNFTFTECAFYQTVSSDLSDLEDIFYDMIVFYSPLGVKSLFENFPNFKQNNTRIGAMGASTSQAIIERGLRLDLKAPTPEAPSMHAAIINYLEQSNK